MSGIQEIGLIVLIIAAIVFLPRLRKPDTPQAARRPEPASGLSVKMKARLRLAIVATFAWLGLAAAYWRPWQEGGLVPFLFAGCGMVALFWGIVWVVVGYRRERRPY